MREPAQLALRRRELLALAGGLLLGRITQASTAREMTWPQFTVQLRSLAAQAESEGLNHAEVGARGIGLLQQLALGGEAFQAAIADSFESGNRYWLWQRLMKEAGLNAGILTVYQQELVALHDHPGATGMLRILSGEVGVWQYDVEPVAGGGVDGRVRILKRVAHRILRPGDVAVLTPESGNVHALQSRTPECRMLDCFIPPYTRNLRHWYQPMRSDWQSRELIHCMAIPEYAFDHA